MVASDFNHWTTIHSLLSRPEDGRTRITKPRPLPPSIRRRPGPRRCALRRQSLQVQGAMYASPPLSHSPPSHDEDYDCKKYRPNGDAPDEDLEHCGQGAGHEIQTATPARAHSLAEVV